MCYIITQFSDYEVGELIESLDVSRFNESVSSFTWTAVWYCVITIKNQLILTNYRPNQRVYVIFEIISVLS